MCDRSTIFMLNESCELVKFHVIFSPHNQYFPDMYFRNFKRLISHSNPSANLHYFVLNITALEIKFIYYASVSITCF